MARYSGIKGRCFCPQPVSSESRRNEACGNNAADFIGCKISFRAYEDNSRCKGFISAAIDSNG